MSHVLECECTLGCRSREHGSRITSAIVRGSEAQAIAYMNSLCHRYYFVTDEVGKTALHTAASCGKRKVVKWLLSKGASLNQRDWESGYTPLHRALFYGQLHVACALIQCGGNISALDHDALTPLDHVNFDRPSIVSFTCSLPTQVYVWGNNTNYNLGQTSQHARGTPECLDSLHHEGQVIIDVALSKFHTLFLASSGRVYTCGHGHGGRLGLETNSPVITPRPVKAFMHSNVIMVAAGPDHSLFLTDSGQVWSCGSNLYHQLGLNPPPEKVYTPRMLTWHKSNKEIIAGIGAAKYHSVIWTSRVLYTFGLNAGQLGHFKNANEFTIVTPRNVSSMVIKDDGSLVSVGVSDGATVLATSCGDIYVLHQYQIRKVASKMHEVVKVACVGGHLDSKVGAEGLIEHGGDDLRIAALTGRRTGHLYLWTEQSSHLSRCLFSIKRKITLVDFCLNRHCLGIVTDDGEAFSAVVLPARERKTSEKPSVRKSWGSSGQLVEFLDHSTCVTLRLTRIPILHRTISIMCDPKGLNFAALQNEPNSFLLDLPQVSCSIMKEDFETLLKEVNELDTIHDVVIVCGARKFFAHSFILACHSEYFCRHLLSEQENLKNDYVDIQKEWGNLHNSEKKYITLKDVPPDAFQEVLTYMYTGSCKFIVPDYTHYVPSHDQPLDNVTGDPPGMYEWTSNRNSHRMPSYSINNEAEQLKSTNKQKKKRGSKLSGVKAASAHPVQIGHSVAKKLEITSLERALDKLKMMDGYIEGETCAHQKDVGVNKEGYNYSRDRHQELWDVMIRSKTGDILGAHKCILAARSEYFRCMFGSSWIEATASKSLNMPLSTSLLSIILDYLYEDESPKLRQCRDPEFVCNVLAVADQFFIIRLREICEDVISGLLTLKNAAELLEFAVSYNAAQLKVTAMQFISLNLTAVLENGSLLSIRNSEVLVQLRDYYRGFIPRMSCRMMTPHDHPPYADELEQVLEERPLVLPDSDEEWDEDSSLKCEKLLSGGGSSSARKKKRQHRNSQGDARCRKISASSVSSSDCDTTRDIEEDFGTLDFSDLEERVPSQSSSGMPEIKISTSKLALPVHHTEDGEAVIQVPKDSSSWQRVCRKKNTVGQSVITPVKSPTESPVQENIDSDYTQSPLISSPAEPDDANTYSRVHGEASIAEFPSLRDSIMAAQKTGQLAKSSKTGKLSQKQRKKLAAEAAAAAAAELTSPVMSKKQLQNSSRNISAPAWGTRQDSIVTSAAVTSSQTLADIMKAEEAKERQTSVPVSIQINKKIHGSDTPIRRGFSWGQDDDLPVGQLNIEREGSGMWSMVASSPTVSPGGRKYPSPDHSHLEKNIAQSPTQLPTVPHFSDILLEEETHSDNLIKERFKPLAVIQLEDRAIEELLSFYGASECFEEKITVTRVRKTVANPIWSK